MHFKGDFQCESPDANVQLLNFSIFFKHVKDNIMINNCSIFIVITCMLNILSTFSTIFEISQIKISIVFVK